MEIPEDAPVKKVVTKVTAIHEKNEPLYYSMSAPEDSRSANFFSLDTTNGEITLAKSLDREFLSRHVLKIMVYEKLDPSVSASTTVIVEVLDVQDNAPIFEKNSYFSEIREDALVGTTVLSVFATDSDEGENGNIVYSLEDGEGSKFLQIDPDSGVISTRTKLDREEKSLFRINVIATDKGSPPKSSQALVEVIVIDVNDNSPKFEEKFYNFTVLENTTIPTVIGKVFANDIDSGKNGKVHYSMVTTTTADLFLLDYDTGELSIRQPLNPRQSPISFLIRAKDGGQPSHSTTVHVEVNIEDINDHAPVFVSSDGEGHSIVVEENVPVGKEVGRLLAVDDDFGTNGEVEYKIVGGNGLSVFELDPLTGALKTLKPIDREEKDKYELEVVAEDKGSPKLNTTALVNIFIKDINDNPPVFEHEVYNLTLSENTPRGKKLIQLVAKDPDLDSKITYKIEKMSKKLFSLVNLGSQGALLSLSQEFVPTDQKLKIVVVALDEDGLQGRCTINIVIDDVNTPPVFIDNPLSVEIPENSPVGFHVLKMNAEDNDREENAKLEFSIDSDLFHIDSESGLITVAKPLDREEQAIHAISIVVSDSGNPPMSSSTILEVVLVDENDNSPKFLNHPYEVKISEDIAVGTSFLQLKAVDPDEGTNGIVNYFLNDTDPTVELDYFRLDSTSGLLRVNKALDREKIQTYVLPVSAVDRGNPSQRSFTNVSITVTDVNDNAPKFEKNSYDFWIAENSPVGTVIGTLRATDPDEGENAKLEFRIFGGQDAKLFEIEADPDQQGVIKILSRTEFDYEAKMNKFVLEIQASSGRLSSTVPIQIHVSDVNDNRPQLKDFFLLIATFEDDLTESDVGNMPSFDPDRNATLEHYLEENDVLGVEEFTGKLFLKALYHRQFNMEQKACVSDGPNTVCGRCLISYINVNEQALKESITVQIHGLSPEQFLDLGTFQRFLDSLSSANPKFVQQNFRIFSVNSDKDVLNVSFFVSVDDNILSLRKVEESVLTNIRNISLLFGHKVNVVHDELCDDEPCPYYQKCRRSLKYVRHNRVYSTENFIMRSLDMLRTFVCECPVGFTTNEKLPGYCNQQLNMCFDSPCFNNATCVPLENDYRCECPVEFTGNTSSCSPFICKNGAECHLEENVPTCKYCRWKRPDADEFCRLRTVSFNGTGSLVIPKTLSRYRWELSIDLATVASSGILFFSGEGNKGDFLEISLETGLLKAEIFLGGQSRTSVKLPDWPENRINDGEWHTVKLTFDSMKLRISVDDCDEQLSLTMARRIGYKHCASETTVHLPSRCSDRAVPCHRSLDLQGSIFLGNRPFSDSLQKHPTGFIGCLRNFQINQKLIDFSDFEFLEKNGDVFAGCQNFRPDKCGFENLCEGGSKCFNKWLGHQCRCPNRLDMKAPSCALESGNSVSFFSEEAYNFWRLPPQYSSELTLNFEFRTRERKTQVIALEFELQSQLFVFSIENGHGLVIIGQEQYFITYPQLADAQWHSVDVNFGSDSVKLMIDSRSEKIWKLPILQSLSTTRQLYSGQAPSTSHPHVFQGCIRNVEVNNVKLKTLEASQTRPGCQVANGCSGEPSCPKNSRCVRDWDRHNCLCLRGYVGDSCIDACSIQGICNNEGLCIRSNSSRGYDCVCPEGFVGPNCEYKSLPKICPHGYHGSFPNCRKCSCSSRRGFKQQCDQKNGRCICKSGTFEIGGRCRACECGYGSSSPFCNPSTGQCPCAGESGGRRCDRCRNKFSVLDKKTLKCVKIRDRCPSELEAGIQWPSTLHGVSSRQSCPGNEMGIAMRKCSGDSEWMETQDYNCTDPQLFDLQTKISGKFDISEVNRQLLNLTTSIPRFRNRNVDLAIDVFEGIVFAEAKSSFSVDRRHSRHARDSQFTKDILDIAEALLDSELTEEQFYKIITLLFDYGILLSSMHESASYLKPFQHIKSNILFSVDRLDSRKYPGNVYNLPKYDQFAPPEPDLEKNIVSQSSINFFNSHRIQVTGPENFATSTVFYSIIPSPRCGLCEHAVVLLNHATATEVNFDPEIFQISFEIDESLGWRLPECVWLDYESQLNSENQDQGKNEVGVIEKLGSILRGDFKNKKSDSGLLKWRTDRGMLIGLNNSHVVCQYSAISGGIFTVLIRNSEGSIVKFSLASGDVPLFSMISVIISFIFCFVSLSLTLFKKDIKLRFIRSALIFSFIGNMIVLFVIRKMTLSTAYCTFRNSVMTFGASSVFAWLFLYSLQIYNAFAEGPEVSCRIISMILGLVIPIIFSGMNFWNPSCSVSLNSLSTWILIGPMVFFVLISFYALSTSFLISFKKKYSIVSAKTSLKKILLIHAVLILGCSIYQGTELFLFFTRRNSNIEFLSSFFLVFSSSIIFYWSTWMIHEEISIKTEKTSMWMNQNFPKIDPTCTLPPLDSGKSYTDRVYDGPPGEWMPDMGLSETYIHHTLQRSLQLPGTPVRSGPYPQILSPAQKVFGNLADGNRSSFSISEGTARIIPSHSTTLVQGFSNTTASNHSSSEMRPLNNTLLMEVCLEMPYFKNNVVMEVEHDDFGGFPHDTYESGMINPLD
ncbi:hypothetical protein FO519_006082, partial [Halicephalobus sp. NKZ332]